MILADFHVHSSFSDGKNTPEDMVQAAIAAGVKTLGFSEHSYVPFDPQGCMQPERILAYRREMDRLREKYQGKIQLLCGIEQDYDTPIPAEGYDYVIGSVHYLCVGGNYYSVDLSGPETLRCVNTAFGGSWDSYAEAYFSKVADVGRRTGANIVGHFDLLTKFAELGVSPDCHSPRYIAAWKAAMTELAHQAVFEINTGAIHRGYRKTPYLTAEMLLELKKLGGGILLSSDAHCSRDILGGFHQAWALAQQVGFVRAGFTDSSGIWHNQC